MKHESHFRHFRSKHLCANTNPNLGQQCKEESWAEQTLTWSWAPRVLWWENVDEMRGQILGYNRTHRNNNHFQIVRIERVMHLWSRNQELVQLGQTSSINPCIFWLSLTNWGMMIHSRPCHDVTLKNLQWWSLNLNEALLKKAWK